MWDEQRGVIGIGYEGESPASLIAKLKGWGVTTLADVRLNPISRKAGFSKKALAAALAEHGIEYVHLAPLGNPRDNREGFAARPDEDDGGARDTYRERLETEAARVALELIINRASTEHVAVMCFESSQLNCHRREVLAHVHDQLDRLVES
jgi:uncharacterized protein (DUF488 family)